MKDSLNAYNGRHHLLFIWVIERAMPALHTSMVYTSQLLVDGSVCFHCGLDLPASPFVTHILQADRPMCCLGCQAASQSIIDAGLESYYLDRTALSATAPMPEALTALNAYDQADFQSTFTSSAANAHHSARHIELSVAGIRCSACGWLIERQLNNMVGMRHCAVNIAMQRLYVEWQPEVLPLSRLLHAIEKLGYTARPFRQDTHHHMLAKERKQMMMRFALSALGGMQAMMYAYSVYLGDYTGIDAASKHYFRWIELLLTTPIVLFAAYPFYQSAWRALKQFSVNMDVPITLAILLTYIASVYATVLQTGDTYFDSVCMFVALILLGRFLELKARENASRLVSDIMLIKPVLAHREEAAGVLVDVPQHVLRMNDVVHVRPGESIPCNGILLSEAVTVSEALLTGEAQPILKNKGQLLLGGSQNYASALVMQVSAAPEVSQDVLMHRLIGRALSERPPAALQADQLAKYFVLGVLLFTVLVALIWCYIDPSKALWITVAVLVATCPCALALATPMVHMHAIHVLAASGFLITRGRVLSGLASATRVVFDKTGTLTHGKLELIARRTLATTLDADSLLLIAVAMERHSNHPIANALRQQALTLGVLTKDIAVDAIDDVAGGGVEAVVDGHTYRLGHAGFVGVTAQSHDTEVYLAKCVNNAWQVLGSFTFNDVVRQDAAALIEYLRAQNIKVTILSGDYSVQLFTLAQSLGVHEVYGGLLPADKVARVAAMQATGEQVVMVGDGVNDGPVLAAADVSIAMSSSADLALMTADGVLLQDELQLIQHAHQLSLLTNKRTRQNVRWAILYNVAALVPAAFGVIPPWLAAVGMSASSLLVVLNATRRMPVKKA